MALIWAPEAIGDLQAIWLFIAQNNPDAADRTQTSIEYAAQRLLGFPKLGRNATWKGMRVLPVAGTPYILVYRKRGADVQIARVFHGAQDWQSKPSP